MAIDGFYTADFYLPEIAGDFGGVVIVPASAVVPWFEHGGESYAWVDLSWFGSGVAILEEIQFADSGAGCVTFHAAAVEGLEIRLRDHARGCRSVLPIPEQSHSQREDH